jgi:predicted TIM-barrel fold metal-dependent hydrolase
LGAGLATLPLARHAHAQQAEGRYIDVHTHLGQQWGARRPLPAGELLRWMDANAIMQAVVMPLISPESYDYVISTDFVLTETKPHRDRLIPFCAIDPRTIELNGIARKIEMLRKYVDAGARGFGEHKCGLPIDDPRNMEIYHACGELGLPVLIHIDNVRNMDQPGLPGLARVLAQCPKTAFLGHGPGWWANISVKATQEEMDGYPKGPVVPGGALDTLMDRFPNIYADLSAGSGANAFARDMDFAREFMIRRADRLCFGTDYLSMGQPVPQLTLFDRLDLPEAVLAKIFRENARRLLGLD